MDISLPSYCTHMQSSNFSLSYFWYRLMKYMITNLLSRRHCSQSVTQQARFLRHRGPQHSFGYSLQSPHTVSTCTVPIVNCTYGHQPPIILYLLQIFNFISTVWVKQIPPEIFWHFFPNGWEFLVQILRAYYPFLSTLDYKFLFN